VILHFGANDCRLRWRDGELLQLTSISEFTRRLGKISRAITFCISRKVVVGIAPPTAELEKRRPGYAGHVRTYNAALRDFAMGVGATFLDIEQTIGDAPIEEFMLEDGYHINLNMHRLLSDVLAESVLRFRIDSSEFTGELLHNS
jgi:lysophospholipase L1-like esterase